MDYKVLYIEDLEAETRTQELNRNNDSFVVSTLTNLESLEQIISEINERDPDLIIFDYILTEGESSLKFTNAPSLAQTLRSLSVGEGKAREVPLVLMSTKDNIVEYYKKDYTSHDLFDYAVTKESAVKNNLPKFRNRCLSFINSYKKISVEEFNIEKILDIKSEEKNSKFNILISQKDKSIYQYSQFIHEHLIRCSGLLIGEDILSARLGVSKKSKDWNKLLECLTEEKYTGIFNDSYNRYWMSRVALWWENVIKSKYSLRHYTAEERCKLLSKRLRLKLEPIQLPKENSSSNYWTICQETKLPLDPSEGVELLDEEVMPWQDRNYVSVSGYLRNIEKYGKKVSDLDRKEMRDFYK